MEPVSVGVNIWKNRGKLYLDIWHNGRRKREALGLTITSDEQHNKEVMRIAEICRSKKEIEITKEKWGVSGNTEEIMGLAEINRTNIEIQALKDKWGINKN